MKNATFKKDSSDVEKIKYIKGEVKKANEKSKSNGCLMRITPLAVWVRNLED
jgi:ADP-ribosylglycohydrolase